MAPSVIIPALTDVENVKLYCRAASGENIDFLRREDVRSDHPSILYGSEPRKVHMAWSESLSYRGFNTIGTGDYFWRHSGRRVDIHEGTADPIGFCEKYVLVEVETGMECEWILREYQAYGEEYIRCKSAIYEICFEPKEYSKDRTLIRKALAKLKEKCKWYIGL